MQSSHVLLPSMPSDDNVTSDLVGLEHARALSRVLDSILDCHLSFCCGCLAVLPPEPAHALCQSGAHVTLAPTLDDVPCQRRGSKHRLDVFQEVLTCTSETVAGGCSQKDGDLTRHAMSRDGLVGDVLDERSPFLLDEPLLPPIVQQCASPAANDGQENCPIARGETQSEVGQPLTRC